MEFPAVLIDLWARLLGRVPETRPLLAPSLGLREIAFFVELAGCIGCERNLRRCVV